MFAEERIASPAPTGPFARHHARLSYQRASWLDSICPQRTHWHRLRARTRHVMDPLFVHRGLVALGRDPLDQHRACLRLMQEDKAKMLGAGAR